MKSDMVILAATLMVSIVFGAGVLAVDNHFETKSQNSSGVYADAWNNGQENDKEAGTLTENDNVSTGIQNGNVTDNEDRELTYTLAKVAATDYFALSVTGVTSERESDAVLTEKYSEYGTLLGKGMPLEEYKAAMEAEWMDCTDYDKEPVAVSIDISQIIRYEDYVNYLKLLSRYEGVYLYQIGTSTDGRALYAIEIDVESEYEKETFVLTGQTHTREYAGGVYILKQLSELITAAQTDDTVMEVLKRYRYAAVPIISIDVREYMIDDAESWSKGNQLYKAYANGTDGNRNYPGLQWGQIAKGSTLRANIESEAGYANYPGDYAGSCNETKAMMKWFYHYIVVEQALIHLDYHQQGSIMYAGKPWQTDEQYQRCVNLANSICDMLSVDNRRKYKYEEEAEQYGLRGEGSTASDFTASLAAGAKFSPAFGYYVMTDGVAEYPLVAITKLDETEYSFTEANPRFATATFEIGYGKSYLGYTDITRAYLAAEYDNYHFSDVLLSLPGLAAELAAE